MRASSGRSSQRQRAGAFGAIGKAPTRSSARQSRVWAKKVLIVATSADKLADTDQSTGCWAEEIMAPYIIFKESGMDVSVVSMKGGKVPIDEASLADQFVTDKVKQFRGDAEMSSAIETTQDINTVGSGSDYDAVFIPGGHGVVYDMVDDSKLQDVISDAFDAGKVVSSVCHGPAAFANVKSKKSGKPIVDGKQVTGFSNTEEDAVGKTQYVPFLLEDKLKELGGTYEKKGDWEECVCVDGNLITGQNPQSSETVAQKVLQAVGA